MEVDVAVGSLIVPCVGEIVVSVSMWTRIPSYFSSCSIEPPGFVSAAVIVIGAGNALPVETSDTVGEPENSVWGGLFGSAEGMNSAIVPLTLTRLPICAAAGGALDVKTEFAWDANYLFYTVREPFPTKTTGASLVFGRVTPEMPLILESRMAENGVIFSDGVEKDFLEFNSGTQAVIGVAERKGLLVE